MPGFSNGFLRGARRFHRWCAVIIALPLLLIVATGSLLLLRKQVSWIEPREERGTGTTPKLDLEALLNVARGVPEAAIRDWRDVARFDLQPRAGLVKIRTFKRWEVQIDAGTGRVLGSYSRRTGILAALHDGSWFSERMPVALFFPVAILTLLVWATGVLLFFLPWLF